MSWKDKLAIGIGALRLAILGDTRFGESHWDLERRGYERNIHWHKGPLVKAIFGGDCGLKGPVFNAVMDAIHAYRPNFAWLLGDLRYPDGIGDQGEYDAYIMGPFGDLGPQHVKTCLVPGNHDEYGDKKERHFMGRKLFERDDQRISYRNYYGAWIYDNAIVVWFDSTVYDVKLGDPEIQDRQETFVHNVLKDVRFKNLKKIVVAHAGVFSNGPHGKTHSNDYRKFELRSIRGFADYMVCGHDHLVQYVGLFRGSLGSTTKYFTSGAMAKKKPSKKVPLPMAGFIVFDANEMKVMEVDTPAGLTDIDEE